MFAEPEDRCYLVELRDDVLNITWNRPEFGNATPPDSVPAPNDVPAERKVTAPAGVPEAAVTVAVSLTDWP